MFSMKMNGFVAAGVPPASERGILPRGPRVTPYLPFTFDPLFSAAKCSMYKQ
jgi:hypothetical protein